MATAAPSSPTTTSSREIMRSLRVHGEGAANTTACASDLNGRFDTIQAAVLIEKLKIFPEEIAARERIARALFGRARRCGRPFRASPRARPRSGRNTPSGCAPDRRDALRRGAEGAGHPDRDLLSQAGAPAGGLPALSRWPRAALPVSERLAARGHQPADARLSRRGRRRTGSLRRCAGRSAEPLDGASAAAGLVPAPPRAVYACA